MANNNRNVSTVFWPWGSKGSRRFARTFTIQAAWFKMMTISITLLDRILWEKAESHCCIAFESTKNWQLTQWKDQVILELTRLKLHIVYKTGGRNLSSALSALTSPARPPVLCTSQERWNLKTLKSSEMDNWSIGISLTTTVEPEMHPIKWAMLVLSSAVWCITVKQKELPSKNILRSILNNITSSILLKKCLREALMDWRKCS